MTKSLIAEWSREYVAAGGSQSSEPPARPYSLTAREIEVLAWVACGKSASAIGEMLDITKRTVDAHVSSIVSKIGAVNRTQAVAIAIRDGLIKMRRRVPGHKPNFARGFLTSLLEELPEQTTGFGLGQPTVNLRPVMAGRRGKKFHAVVDRTAFGVAGAVIKPADAGEGDGASAHRARLQRDIEIAIVEPLRTQPARRLADSDHFGMGGRIVLGERAVASARDDLAVTHDNAADRHLAGFAGGPRFGQGHIHE